MSYRNDLDALEARHASLEAEVAVRAAERDDARRVLEDARARARLPVLDNIRVASPCAASWDAMTAVSAEGRVRHCADCDKNVFDLSAMTRDQAEATIVQHQGKLCVRYYQRADGKILTADCPVGVRRRRRRRWVAAGAVAMLAGSAFGWNHHRSGPTPASVALEVQLGGESADGERVTTHEEVPFDDSQVKIMGLLAAEPRMGQAVVRSHAFDSLATTPPVTLVPATATTRTTTR